MDAMLYAPCVHETQYLLWSTLGLHKLPVVAIRGCVTALPAIGRQCCRGYKDAIAGRCSALHHDSKKRYVIVPVSHLHAEILKNGDSRRNPWP